MSSVPPGAADGQDTAGLGPAGGVGAATADPERTAGAQDPPPPGTNREVLAHPGFRRLLTAWTVSNLGDSALYITTAIWVKAMTGSDQLAALVFLVLGLPAFLSPAFGLLADRLPRRRLLIGTNIATAAVVLTLLAVSTPAGLWLVYAATFLYACSSYVNAAAQSGLLKDLLPGRLLAPANGMFSSIDQALRIVSPLAAAAVFGVWGMAPIIVATAACFLLGAVLLRFVPLRDVVHPEADPGSWWRQAAAGFTELLGRPRLRTAVIAFMLVVAASGITNSTIFATVDTGLGMPPEFLSVVVALQGIVSVSVGLAASSVIRRFGFEATIMAGSVLFTVGMASQAAGVLWVVLAGIVPFAAGVTLMIVAAVTLRQHELPSAVQGRGAAAMQLLNNAPQAMTAGAAAALLGVIDYRLLVLAGATLALSALLPFALRRRK
ncbi:MFS transporter [Zafaria sp. Z1313]|uniref:MFS transporter n=1 Tax=unclassified Zafaria TaxID=2828765 RepID=UPI002E794271|nr:MFS transporter [Zafaria sp. J156]MEE1619858.1 MFS transporter [Zafaria sp. J156]